MNLVDVVVTIFLIHGGIVGLLRGFVGSVARLVGGLGSILIAVVYAPRIITWMQQRVDLMGPLEEFLRRNVKLPWLGYYDAVLGQGTFVQNQTRDDYQRAAMWILTAVAFVIICIVIGGLANAFAQWIDLQMRGTPFTLINRVFGGVFGVLQTGLVIGVILVLLLPMGMLIPSMERHLNQSFWVARFATLVRPISEYLLERIKFKL